MVEPGAQIRAIAVRHGARNVRVFGSFARGDAGLDSDLDLLISLEEGRTLLDLVALKQELEEALSTATVELRGCLQRILLGAIDCTGSLPAEQGAWSAPTGGWKR